MSIDSPRQLRFVYRDTVRIARTFDQQAAFAILRVLYASFELLMVLTEMEHQERGTCTQGTGVLSVG